MATRPKLLLIWSGAIIGVSFVATPVKFRAPNLTLPVAIEVGKVTFHAMQALECSLFGALLFDAAFLHKAELSEWRLLGGLGACLSLQTLWLMPMLDKKSEPVIKGLIKEQRPRSFEHSCFVVVEVLKLVLATLGGWLGTR